jgi:hypothetical protein
LKSGGFNPVFPEFYQYGVPVACGGGNADMFLDNRVGISLTQSPEIQRKPADDANNPDLPLVTIF